MAFKLGLAAKLYRLTTGTRASWGAQGTDGLHSGAAPAALAEIGNVQDLTINGEKGKADVSTRANNGWDAEVGTLKNGTVTFKMVYDTADTHVMAFLTAFINNTAVALAALGGDKATSGTIGLWADFSVNGFQKEEPLKEAQMVSISVSPTYSAVGPQFVKIP